MPFTYAFSRFQTNLRKTRKLYENLPLYGMRLQVHVYKFVVEDVIKNVKEDFLNEGVEPEVLEQLQEVRMRRFVCVYVCVRVRVCVCVCVCV